MLYAPYEKLAINWAENHQSFMLSLPWMSMEVDVTEEDKEWVEDGVRNLQSNTQNLNVQRFIQELKDYPVFYIQPRSLASFRGKDLQPCTELTIDCSTPAALVSTFGCEIAKELLEDLPSAWTWDRERILDKARIEGTDLYDPLSLISYLICYRLDWESVTWSGQDGFGQSLERLLKKDEKKFFEAIGWISRQSWYVTTESCKAMEPALTFFSTAKDLINHFICDEVGHYKFMEQVFDDLGLDKDAFVTGAATKWMLASHARTAVISPLAFSGMINLFEAAYYEGQDPISRTIKLSSKPHAARGYDLHYKINQEHRHCDMPLLLSSHLAPQRDSHAVLTICLFELTLHFLDQMEKRLAQTFEIH